MKTNYFSFFSYTVMLFLIVFSACKKETETENEEPKPNQPPICIIQSPNNGQEILKGDSIAIEVQANDEDGSIVKVRFFIDGIGVGSVDTPPYSYLYITENDSLGTHFLKVTAIDNKGDSKSDEISITLANGKPSAGFSAVPTSGFIPLNVQFVNESSVSPTDFQWDFGDGVSSIATNPSHIYNEAGVYSVTLIVGNQYGTDTLVKQNLIVASEEPIGSYTDPRDGEVYNILQIGDLSWFGRNLNYEADNSWWFDDNPDFGPNFGRLYTWESAMTACPSGWHLPSDDEWKNLEIGLGMSEFDVDLEGWRGTDEGLRMKATTSWDDNGNGTNTSGFNAYSGGWHDGQSTSNNMGISAVWWTGTEASFDKAIRRVLRFDEDGVYRNANWKVLGFSVRCVQDY